MIKVETLSSRTKLKIEETLGGYQCGRSTISIRKEGVQYSFLSFSCLRIGTRNAIQTQLKLQHITFGKPQPLTGIGTSRILGSSLLKAI